MVFFSFLALLALRRRLNNSDHRVLDLHFEQRLRIFYQNKIDRACVGVSLCIKDSLKKSSILTASVYKQVRVDLEMTQIIFRCCSYTNFLVT